MYETFINLRLDFVGFTGKYQVARNPTKAFTKLSTWKASLNAKEGSPASFRYWMPRLRRTRMILIAKSPFPVDMAKLVVNARRRN